MLTVQMKNQDPLNPIQSSDFAVQLATFSGVEQQVRTNELLTKLSDGFGTSGMSDLAGWIGKEVRTSGLAHFDGAPLTLYPGKGGSGGDRAFLVVRDEAGLPAARTAMTGDSALTWAGVRTDGSPFPPGLYRFEVEVTEGDDVVRTVPVEHYGRVKEVRMEIAGPMLMLEGGATAGAREVLAVRAGNPLA
jgi:flagellar basal-body rod modification protein FlgD